MLPQFRVLGRQTCIQLKQSVLALIFLAVTNIIVNRLQSELEHRTSKARFLRTNGRSAPQQLSKIEQRQRLIRSIREKQNSFSRLQTKVEEVPNDTREQYNVGKTQNMPIHIPSFLQKNVGDPAIEVG
jgi:hypothetical protein